MLIPNINVKSLNDHYISSITQNNENKCSVNSLINYKIN